MSSNDLSVYHRYSLLHAGARLLDAGLVPDAVTRAAIRRIVRRRQRQTEEPDPARRAERRRRFAADRSRGPVAIHSGAANRQHYEVPAGFYEAVLGPHLKYSSAFWAEGDRSLGDAEARMLGLYGERAALADGQRILELGCGWGSLSLWMARRYPGARIVGVSNSASQKAWIDARARAEGLANLEIVTADMNVFEASGRFDRIVSVEMFEHMRNWRVLLERIARWLEDDGRVFVHIFTHRTSPYTYEVEGPSDWMAEHFFTGGIMPSDDLLEEFADVLEIEARWQVSGTHYQRTAEAWLANLDASRSRVWPLLEATYGRADARRWWSRWRVFFMACAELWGWDGGQEWLVSHYRLRKPTGPLAGA
jgi:cyclopropane-fatty-acyl-phospholipid synthase